MRILLVKRVTLEHFKAELFFPTCTNATNTTSLWWVHTPMAEETRLNWEGNFASDDTVVAGVTGMTLWSPVWQAWWHSGAGKKLVAQKFLTASRGRPQWFQSWIDQHFWWDRSFTLESRVKCRECILECTNDWWWNESAGGILHFMQSHEVAWQTKVT